MSIVKVIRVGIMPLERVRDYTLAIAKGTYKRKPTEPKTWFTSIRSFAGVRCGAHPRKELERLCRYITRPAIANERLSHNAKGHVLLQLKSPWRDGTTHFVMSPLEFMQRLHLIRFHGVLAPHGGLRATIVPGPAHKPR